MCKKISILGCGWVGKALKLSLEKQGYIVNCLSRDISINILSKVYECDTIVIAIPPSTDNYLRVLEQTFDSLEDENPPQVIFLSSISYYDGKASVLEADIFIQMVFENAVLLRLGGLMGYDRIAGKYTAGKVLISNSKTNYVHRDDVISIIEKMIGLRIKKQIFDVVAPNQTYKKEIFEMNAKRFGFKKTIFGKEEKQEKLLSSKKLCETLDYIFIKPHVLAFWD